MRSRPRGTTPSPGGTLPRRPPPNPPSPAMRPLSPSSPPSRLAGRGGVGGEKLSASRVDRERTRGDSAVSTAGRGAAPLLLGSVPAACALAGTLAALRGAAAFAAAAALVAPKRGWGLVAVAEPAHTLPPLGLRCAGPALHAATLGGWGAAASPNDAPLRSGSRCAAELAVTTRATAAAIPRMPRAGGRPSGVATAPGAVFEACVPLDIEPAGERDRTRAPAPVAPRCK
jgi:hypothetical protein